MTGAGARRKGHNWERELVHRFRAVMPGADIKRGFQTRGGGAEEADVEMPFLHIEAKCGKKPIVRAALAQATRDAKPGKIPVAVVKDDRQDPFVVLSLENFLDILEEWYKAGLDPN